jgi:hypothetical protein
VDNVSTAGHSRLILLNYRRWANYIGRTYGHAQRSKPSLGADAQFDGQAFVLLSLSFLDYKNFGICTKGETILFYGRGLREFLLWFNYPEIYFAEGYYEELVNRAFHK